MTISKRRNSKQSRAHRLEALVGMSPTETKKKIRMALLCIHETCVALNDGDKTVPILAGCTIWELTQFIEEAIADLKNLTGV